jgi:hypothetical protein
MWKSMILLSSLLLLTACSHYPSKVDDNFGKSVRSALIAQIADLKAPESFTFESNTDGRSMKSAVDRYQRSFEIPPPATNVFNIGVGNSAAGGAGLPAGTGAGSGTTGR